MPNVQALGAYGTLALPSAISSASAAAAETLCSIPPKPSTSGAIHVHMAGGNEGILQPDTWMIWRAA